MMFGTLLFTMGAGMMLLALAACGAQSPAVAATATPGHVLDTGVWPAKHLNVPVEQVSFSTMQPMRWPDRCLGMDPTGEMCTQAIVPAWQMVFVVAAQPYEVRTDESGTLIWQTPYAQDRIYSQPAQVACLHQPPFCRHKLLS